MVVCICQSYSPGLPHPPLPLLCLHVHSLHLQPDLLLSIYPEKTVIQKRYIYPSVHCNTLYNSQDMEATWNTSDRRMEKEDVIRVHNGILLSHEKERDWVICSDVDRPRFCHTKWSKSAYLSQFISNPSSFPLTSGSHPQINSVFHSHLDGVLTLTQLTDEQPEPFLLHSLSYWVQISSGSP